MKCPHCGKDTDKRPIGSTKEPGPLCPKCGCEMFYVSHVFHCCPECGYVG